MSGDSAAGQLRRAIEAIAAERAPELMAEARAEAEAKVRSILVEAFAESLLAESARSLGSVRKPTAPARPATPARPGPRDAPTIRPEPSAAQPDAAELGYYVYGVVYGDEETPDELAGVDSRYSTSLVEEHGLAAIVSRVPMDEFGEERLRENLNDVEWLEEKARAHEDVLDAALERATVVPLRLCTIYSTERRVREMLDRDREVFLDALERLEGKSEWGVKLIAEPQALERAAAKKSNGKPLKAPASRGTEYMDRKRREATARDQADHIAEEWASAVHDRLAQAASEALLNPVQRPEVSGYDGEMLLNGVYLVDNEELEDFRALVDHIADEYQSAGAAVELTGPWPPYNFVKSSIEAAR